MRRLAFEAEVAGFAVDALRYADALLQRDPHDSTALVVRSKALRSLGQIAAAKQAARAAWQHAEGDPGRFGASMAMAQALSTEGRRGAAQWWLRRAAEFAPSDRAEALAKRDFAYVKSRNPWDIQINTSAAPSSNVNNGSRQDRLTLAGLPFEFEIPGASRALSGFKFGLGLRGTYRFAPHSPGRQTLARFGVLGQWALLSDEARVLAPTAKDSDFAYGAVELGLDHQRRFEVWTLKAGTTLGRNWHGGLQLSDYAQLDLGADRGIGAAGRLSFGLALDRIWRADSAIQSSDRVETRVGYDHRLASGDRLGLSLSASQTQSASPEVKNQAVGLSLEWAKVKPVAGMGLSAGLSAEAKEFPNSRYVAGGREDFRLTANLSIRLDQVSYMGFTPVLDLRASRNRSNAALFDTEEFGITLGIKSSF